MTFRLLNQLKRVPVSPMMINLNMQENDMGYQMRNLIMKFDQSLQLSHFYENTYKQLIFVEFILLQLSYQYTLMSDYKKPLLIGASIVGLGFLGLFVKNYIEETKFKPLAREQLLRMYKTIRKQNYFVLKQVAIAALSLARQFSQITPEMIKGYLQGPQSPVKFSEMFDKNIAKVCEANSITVQQFQFNLAHFKQDPDLKKLIDLSEKEFQTSMSGKVPMFPVKVPESLTKQKILQIQSKIIKQKYLYQIGIFRKLKNHTQQELIENPQLMSGLPNPESEQHMLEQEGLGENDQPASAVLHAAILKFRVDDNFKQNLISIENSFQNIFNRYQPKIRNKKITQEQFVQLQDEIIYFQYI